MINYLPSSLAMLVATYNSNVGRSLLRQNTLLISEYHVEPHYARVDLQLNVGRSLLRQSRT